MNESFQYDSQNPKKFEKDLFSKERASYLR